MYDVVIAGSGFSGICLGIFLRRYGIENFIILEKGEDLGGTWWYNTYPGAECDIPSALYSYSFEGYPFWRYKWSRQSQILEYIHHCANKYNIGGQILYTKEVTEVLWKQDLQRWRVRTRGGETFESRFFVSAIGQLHIPRLPDIPGLSTFYGPFFHSARWNHGLSLSNLRTGVIGNAASAIQFIPEITPQVKTLHIFQRSANWILPKPDSAYRPWQIWLRQKAPVVLRMERFWLWLKSGILYFLMTGYRIPRKIGEWYARRYLLRSVEDPKLRARLIPDYPMGAKRILFSDLYYQTLNEDHVHVHTSSIKSILPGGIELDDGSHIDLDVIILATGFETHPFLKNVHVLGKNGLSLREKWAEGETAYLGMLTSDFPNFFMMYGPQTNLGHSSIITMLEAQASYIARIISQVFEGGYAEVVVKDSAEEQYMEEINSRLSRTIWNSTDKSWYKSGGRIVNNWPGRTMEYMWRTARIRRSDLIWR